LIDVVIRYIAIRTMARKPVTGPSSDPELLILSSLAEGPKHGYAIMVDVGTFADVQLGPGTLYSAITRLVENGWIEPCKASGRQRPYRLTPGGRQHLQTQLEKIRQLAIVGLRRLRTI
jgi:DNA-binding PadR family transcriptional regulator